MEWTRRLYIRLLGLTALAAVGSFWWQLPGLSGPSGIVPAGAFLEAVNRAQVPWSEVPSLARLWPGEGVLHVLCGLAVAAGVCLVLLVAPRVALLVLWASWLSLVEACHPWLDFQWDILLVEAALVSIPFAPAGWLPSRTACLPPARGARLLLAVLACKVTFESGLVKLLSGDDAWTGLTALTYHWWTQPLPTWTSAVAARLPLWVQMAMCGLALVAELPVPLLALGPRTARLIAAGGIIGLQAALSLLGNYAYFGLLTAVLAVPLLDDRALSGVRAAWRAVRRRAGRTLPVDGPEAGAPVIRRRPGVEPALLAAALMYGVVSIVGFGARWGVTWPGPLLQVVRPFLALHSINAYGAFAQMTREREEIEVELTRDGVTWTPVVFPHKPGPVERWPGFVAPLQPRLDWQMWFAALSSCERTPWMVAFHQRLLEDSAPVRALLEAVPPGPPLMVRTRVHRYRFAPADVPAFWTRTEVGAYCPPLMLGPDGRLRRAPP